MIYCDNYLAAAFAIIVFMLVWGKFKRVFPAVALSLLILAVSGIVVKKSGMPPKTVLIIDTSNSMTVADKADLDNVEADKVYSFDDIEISANRPDYDGNVSDVQGALYYAINEIKDNGRIVLYSDLLENKGDLLRAVDELRERNISLEVISADYRRENEIILKSLSLPDHISYGQAVKLAVEVESSLDTSADIVLADEETESSNKYTVQLKTGMNDFTFPVNTSSARLSYHVTVSAPSDTVNENNAGTITANIMGKLRICVIGSKGDVEALARSAADYAVILNCDADGELVDADVYAVSDMSHLTDKRISDLSENVQRGSGLLVSSSVSQNKDSDINAGYNDLLPAGLLRQEQKNSPDGCIVFIVDTSGSMQGARLVLAREIIRSSVKKLTANDKVGIVEFYGNRKWALPIQNASAKNVIERAVNRLTAGGGTVILPALQEAYYGILNIEASSRHIIVITDGGIEKADYDQLLQKISDDNINVSFIMTGPAANAGFLSDMSVAGGGRFFHARDRFSIPEINIKTMSNMDSALYKRAEGALFVADWEGENDLEAMHLPEEYRYIPQQRKYGTVSMLRSGDDDLITSWQYGLGRICFNTTDIFARPEGGDLQRNLLRYLSRRGQGSSSVNVECDHEINSCEPDRQLADQIMALSHTGKTVQASHVDISVWLVLTSLLFFVLQIFQRRLPGKMHVLFAGLLIFHLSTASYADSFSGLTAKAVQAYPTDKMAAYEMFIEASEQAEIMLDERYALSWAAVCVQGTGETEKFERFLISKKNYLSLSILLQVYGMNADFVSAITLLDEPDIFSNLMEEEVISLKEQLVNIALIAREYDTAKRYFTNIGDKLSLIKLLLLTGENDSAVELVDSITDQGSSSELLTAAAELKDMGFIEPALRKTLKVRSRRDKYCFSAICQAADIYIRSGQKEQFIDLLDSAVLEYELDNSQLYDIAIMLEREGYSAKAISLHTLLAQRTDSPEPMMRIAGLYKKAGDVTTASNIWLHLWRDNNDSFILYQIIPNLLDLAAKNGTLADLAIELEDKIISDEAEQKDLDLLTEIYMQADDPLALLEIVRQYYHEENLDSLKMEYHVFRAAGMYSRCCRVIDRLIEIDPGNKLDYLQQMAVVALQAHDNERAVRLGENVMQLAASIGLQFAGGVFALAGDYQRAEQLYRQLIEESPDNSELWLLWAEAAEKQPQSRQQAISIMYDMLSEDISDDMFIVACDILINLEASVDALSYACDLAMAKILKNPGKMDFYQLAADLQAEVFVPADQQSALYLQQACYAGQGREVYISEAMNCLGKSNPLSLDLARVLVFMGVKCSPARNVDFGKLFMANGETAAAEYLFRVNSLLNAANADMYFTISESYQRQADFDAALAVMSEGLALYPNNVHFIIETACIYEITGNYQRAAQLYLQACSLTDNKLQDNSKDSSERNVDSRQLYARMARQGLIVCYDGELPDGISAGEVNNVMPPKPSVVSGSADTASSDMPDDNEELADLSIDLAVADMQLEELAEVESVTSDFYRKVRELMAVLNQHQAEVLYDDFSERADVTGCSTAGLYVKAALAWKLGRGDSARRDIVCCYQQQPLNRYVEISLKRYYEIDGLYGQLAEIMHNNADYGARNSFFWRELTRIYYLAGDMDNALRASSYAAVDGHDILVTMDRLFLYDKLNDIDRLKQYFRKYQIDCRRNGKYYSLKWNYWDQDIYSGSYKAMPAYIFLAGHKEFLDVFVRYYRVVNDSRRDSKVFTTALADCLQLNSYYSPAAEDTSYSGNSQDSAATISNDNNNYIY